MAILLIGKLVVNTCNYLVPFPSITTGVFSVEENAEQNRAHETNRDVR